MYEFKQHLSAALQDIEGGEVVGQDETGVPGGGFGGIQEGYDFGRHFALIQEDNRRQGKLVGVHA